MDPFTFKASPNEGEVVAKEGQLVGLRWNRGVLEQGIRITYFIMGAPTTTCRYEIQWFKVPEVDED